MEDRAAWVFRVRDKATGMIYGCAPPFVASLTGTATKTGAVLTTGKSFQISKFDTAGALKKVLRVDRQREPVGPSSLREYVRLQIQQGRGNEESWNHLSGVPLPDSMPAFTKLLVDDRDWIWAKIHEWDTRIDHPWMVFDPEGWARGIVRLPAGLRVWHIGHDFVLGSSEDGEGREIIRRHTLRRAKVAQENRRRS